MKDTASTVRGTVAVGLYSRHPELHYVHGEDIRKT